MSEVGKFESEGESELKNLSCDAALVLNSIMEQYGDNATKKSSSNEKSKDEAKQPGPEAQPSTSRGASANAGASASVGALASYNLEQSYQSEEMAYMSGVGSRWLNKFALSSPEFYRRHGYRSDECFGTSRMNRAGSSRGEASRYQAIGGGDYLANPYKAGRQGGGKSNDSKGCSHGCYHVPSASLSSPCGGGGKWNDSKGCSHGCYHVPSASLSSPCGSIKPNPGSNQPSPRSCGGSSTSDGSLPDEESNWFRLYKKKPSLSSRKSSKRSYSTTSPVDDAAACGAQQQQRSPSQPSQPVKKVRWVDGANVIYYYPPYQHQAAELAYRDQLSSVMEEEEVCETEAESFGAEAALEVMDMDDSDNSKLCEAEQPLLAAAAAAGAETSAEDDSAVEEMPPPPRPLSTWAAASMAAAICDNEINHNREIEEQLAEVTNTMSDIDIQPNFSSYYCIVNNINAPERLRLLTDVESISDVTLSLVYSDKSTQLRSCVKTNSKATDLLICFAKTRDEAAKEAEEDTGLRLVLLPLTDFSSMPFYRYCREVVRIIMNNEVIVYNGNELLGTIVDVFDFKQQEVVTKWNVHDVLLMTWLIYPDEVTQNFRFVVETFNIEEPDKPQGYPRPYQASHYKDMVQLALSVQKVYVQLEPRGLLALYDLVERRVMLSLAIMSSKIVQVDHSGMICTFKDLKTTLDSLEKEIYTKAGQRFNINSPVQLREVLFTRLMLQAHLHQTRSNLTPGGEWSTSESVLQKLKEYHPLPGHVLEYRKLEKFRNTYVEGLLRHTTYGYIQTSWSQTSCSSGRVTCASPNIQGIPRGPLTFTSYVKDIASGTTIPTQIQASIRGYFRSNENCSFLSADFQQIELRLLAHFCGHGPLLQHFVEQQDKDIFVVLAAAWLGEASCNVKLEQREQAKRIVYAVMYGAGAEKLAENLQVPTDEAKRIKENFMDRFPMMEKFRQSCIMYTRQHGCQRTLFNRLRNIPDIRSTNLEKRLAAERQAVNFKIQGSAADLCKIAMLRIENALMDVHPKQRKNTYMLYQIHDEIIIHVPDELVPHMAGCMRKIMENSAVLCKGFGVELLVPLKVSLKLGKTWGDMQEVNLPLVAK